MTLYWDDVRQQRANVSASRRSALEKPVARERISAVTFVPRSECIQAILRETKSAASIAQDENRQFDNIGLGHGPSNSDTRRHGRGGSPCQLLDQSHTCQSTMCALRMLRALPLPYLNLNHLKRMPGDRLSTRVLTCFRGDHRKVDPRRGCLTDTRFHQMPFSLRTRQDATCQ